MWWGRAVLHSPLCSLPVGALCDPGPDLGLVSGLDQYEPDAAGGAAQVLVGGAQHKAGDGDHAGWWGSLCAALPSPCGGALL